MSVRISTTNSKLGLIPSISLPPVKTCRKNCPCGNECYATKGRYRFENVIESMNNNLDEFLSDPESYFSQIKYAINNGITSYSYFRWHSAGDIVNEDYFFRMVRLANELPLTKFLAFTKKFELVNNYISSGNTIPENLNIVYSAWGSGFKIKNPYNFPIAYVRFKEEKKTGKIPDNAVECSGDCTHCLQCWNIHKGECVVFNKH